MSKTKDVAEVFQNWFDDQAFNMHTILPGKFLSYEGHSTGKAKVQPLLKLRNRLNQIIQIEPIDDVPVIMPRVGNFELKFPIQNGDGCILLFSEASLGNFLNGKGNIVEADDLNRFDLTDCIAIPGLYGFSNTPSSTCSIEIDDLKTITLLSNLGKVEIEDNGNITFNDGTESFLLGDSFETAMTTVINLLIAHTHDVVGVQAGAGTITSSVSTALATLTNPVTGNLSTQIKGK